MFDICPLCDLEVDNLFTCTKCGKNFCDDCGDDIAMLCENCAEEERKSNPIKTIKLYNEEFLLDALNEFTGILQNYKLYSVETIEKYIEKEEYARYSPSHTITDFQFGGDDYTFYQVRYKYSWTEKIDNQDIIFIKKGINK